MTSEIHTSKVEELRVVHQPLARHDQAEKIAGTTRYAGDLAFAGMLHARLVRSQVPSARLTRRDVTAAAAVPGVVAVLLGEDVPNNEIRVDVPGQTIAVGALKASMQVLATDRVRFHGEPIALVIAETEDALADRLRAGRGRVRGPAGRERPRGGARRRTHHRCTRAATCSRSGTSTAATSTRRSPHAAVVVEETYRTQFVDHAYLEPEAGVGWLDDDGVMNLRVATQVIEHYRDVARILGVPDSKVRVIAPYVGGGFGGKEDMTVEPYLAIAVHHTRRPVRMLWTRNESLLARAKRHRNVHALPHRRRRRRHAARPRHRDRLRRRRLRLPVRAGAAVLDRARVRPVPRAERADPLEDRLHEQPADLGVPRVRRDADGARLRVADRRGVAQARDRPR